MNKCLKITKLALFLIVGLFSQQMSAGILAEIERLPKEIQDKFFEILKYDAPDLASSLRKLADAELSKQQTEQTKIKAQSDKELAQEETFKKMYEANAKQAEVDKVKEQLKADIARKQADIDNAIRLAKEQAEAAKKVLEAEKQRAEVVKQQKTEQEKAAKEAEKIRLNAEKALQTAQAKIAAEKADEARQLELAEKKGEAVAKGQAKVLKEEQDKRLADERKEKEKLHQKELQNQKEIAADKLKAQKELKEQEKKDQKELLDIKEKAELRLEQEKLKLKKEELDKEKEVKKELIHEESKAATEKEKNLAKHWADHPEEFKTHLETQNALAAINADKQKEANVQISKDKIAAIIQATKDIMNDKQRLMTVGGALAGTVILSAAGIYAFKYGLPYLFEKLMIPSLVEETSALTAKEFIKYKIMKIKQPDKFAMLSDIVVTPENEILKKRIVQGAIANRKMRGSGFQLNYLLYGEPGTGKTCLVRAIAKELQKHGYQYAITNGGKIHDLLSTGKAVGEFSKLLKWAQDKPTVLFIDEIDAFCKDPNKMSEELLAVYNAFLNLTGTENKNLILMGATNNPNNLPRATLSRFSGGIFHMGLPGFEQRAKIVANYVRKYIKQPGYINSSVITTDVIKDIATKTEGFAGRDLSYLVISLERAALADNFDKPVITQKLVDEIVEKAIEQKKSIGHFTSFGGVINTQPTAVAAPAA